MTTRRLSQSPIELDAPDPARDSGRRLRGRGRGRIHDYLEAAGHGDDEQGPLFRPIRNNASARIDKALVAEGRHRGAVRHVEKTRGIGHRLDFRFSRCVAVTN
jgi:hypothetical protein